MALARWRVFSEGVRPVGLSTRRGRLAAVQACPPPAAPAPGQAVLVSGYLSSKDEFIPILALLSRAGYRVTAYDQLGQYESIGPPDPDAYSIAALAEDLEDVLLEVGQGRPVHVVGRCAGGFVARSAALARPDLVRSLTLLASGPTFGESEHAEKPAQVEEIILAEGVEGLWDRIQRDERIRKLTPWTRKYLQERAVGTCGAHLIGLGRSLSVEPFAAQALSSLGVPMMVAFGSEDIGWLPHVQRGMADRIGARVEVIPGADHNPVLSHPKTTAEVTTGFWRHVDRQAVTR